MALPAPSASSKSSPHPTPAMRNTQDGPWCWQHKAALRKIREAFDQTHDVSSALAIYLALTEIASDHGSPSFQTTHAWITKLSGCSVKTVQRRLAVLQQIGIVSIATPSLRAPSTYVLCSIGHHDATLSHHDATFGHGENPVTWPTSEEKERKPKKEERSIAAIAADSPHKVFIDLWMEAYQNAFGTAYLFQNAKDGSAVKRLLIGTGQAPQELIALAGQAWSKPALFHCKQAVTIAGFASRFNEITAELRHGGNPPPVPRLSGMPPVGQFTPEDNLRPF